MKVKCPKCKKGFLLITTNLSYTDADRTYIYKCDKCGEEVKKIVNSGYFGRQKSSKSIS